jgi:hypothetical protein
MSTRFDKLSSPTIDRSQMLGGGHTGWHRGGTPYGPYQRHRGSTKLPTHRHRTLVLNGSNQSCRPDEVESLTVSDASSSSSWVSRNDRHLQLINSNIYEKDAQARVRAIEQSRRQTQILRDDRERAKLISHFNHVANSRPNTTNAQGSPDKYEVAIQGIRFLVTKNGGKHVKVPG